MSEGSQRASDRRSPSPNGPDGEINGEPGCVSLHAPERDARGRFPSGNMGGTSNSYAARMGRWRAIMTEAVTDDETRAGVAALVAAAKRGE
jgi:hypothetical protein